MEPSCVQNQPISKEMMSKVCKYGTFYNPATAHYNNGLCVVCDRCYRQNLNVCIGYDKYDLCMKCIEEISAVDIQNKQKSKNPLDEVKTRMLVSQYDYPKCIKKQWRSTLCNKLPKEVGSVVAKMMPSQFMTCYPNNSTNKDTVTLIEQSQFQERNNLSLPVTYMHQSQFQSYPNVQTYPTMKQKQYPS